jgi:NDP-sugar pyrophosphorylase family protein
VLVAVHHRAQVIRDHFAADPHWSDLVFVSVHQRGTGADLLDCLPRVPTEAFVVWNGDTVVDLDLPALLTLAADDPARGLIALTRRPDVPNEGAFYVGDDGTVLASLEAVPPHPIPQTFAWRGSSTGVLLLTRSLLAPFSSASPASLEVTILPSLIADRRMRAFDNGTRYFIDFGTPARLDQLNHDQVRFS